MKGTNRAKLRQKSTCSRTDARLSMAMEITPFAGKKTLPVKSQEP